MKQGHLTILFLILYSSCFLLLWIKQKEYDSVLEEKKRVEESLKDAMEQAGKELAKVMYEPETVRLRTFETAFLEAWYIYMGVLYDLELQEELRLHLPMLVFVQENGAYFYYAKEEKAGKTTELVYEWTELQEFSIPEGSTEQKKKSYIADVLEQNASEIVTKHNEIAKQHGLNYQFHAPSFLQDTSKTLEFPMMFAVFQGWPLTASGNHLYENCLDAGVYLKEVRKYVIELPKGLEDARCYYHEKNCVQVMEGNGRFLPERLSKEEAMKKYGAFACNVCIPDQESRN